MVFFLNVLVLIKKDAILMQSGKYFYICKTGV